MNVTYKHLRLFVEEEPEGWLAYVCDLDQFRFVHEGSLFHATVEGARTEAQTNVDLILGETTDIDWSGAPTLKAKTVN